MTFLSLIIKSVTWKKESYGLFDYENKNTTSSILKTTKPGFYIIYSSLFEIINNF